MALFEGHHDHAVIDRDCRAVGEGPVIGDCRHPEIVDDQIEVILRNDLADPVLDFLKDLLGRLDAGAGRRADMELDHAAVDRRIEIAADKDEHHGPKRQNKGGGDRDNGPAVEQRPEQFDITFPQPLETALERRMEAGEEAPHPSLPR